jgi:hypothetical protein
MALAAKSGQLAMPASGERATAEIYHMQDGRANRWRSKGAKAHDASTWVKRSGSIESHDQSNRVTREYSYTDTTSVANYRSAIELQDCANRIQEHWRATHNALHPPTAA